MRVVSLLPSATDTVIALGLGDLVVGISHECENCQGEAVTASKIGEPGEEMDSREVDALSVSFILAL